MGFPAQAVLINFAKLVFFNSNSYLYSYEFEVFVFKYLTVAFMPSLLPIRSKVLKANNFFLQVQLCKVPPTT